MANTVTKRRTNGCQDPLHPYQVATWVLAPICYIIAVLEVIYLYPIGFEIPYIFILSVFTILSVIFVIYTTACNPEFKDSYVKPTELERSCYICKMQTDQSTRHCTKCNKCVYGFDHHCIWLNNCVGRKNYKPFLVALFSATIMVFLETVIGIVTFILYFAQKKKFEDNLSDLFGCKEYYEDDKSVCKTPKLPGYGLIIIDVVYVILLIIMFYYLIDLAIFHIKLIHRGISTYQYIIGQQQQQQKQPQPPPPPPPAEEPKQQPTSLEEGKDNTNTRVENEIQLTIIGSNNNNNNNNNAKYQSPPPKLQDKVSFSSASSISLSASPSPSHNITSTQPPLHPQNQHTPPQQQSPPDEAYKSRDFTITKMSNEGNTRAARPSNVEIDFENKNENSSSGGVGGGGDVDVVAHKITVASKEAAIPESSDSDQKDTK